MNTVAYLFAMFITTASHTMLANNAEQATGLSDCIHGYVKCIRCHYAKRKVGTASLPNTAFYTRHRATGNCRIYKGADYTQIAAEHCSAHNEQKVKNLLEICGRAVTYHAESKKIVSVEADPIPGRRDHVAGGAYGTRITVKPKVHRAEIWQCPATKKYMVCLRDENGLSLITFACLQSPKKISTTSSWFWEEAEVYYELDAQMLAKATLYVDTNGITTAQHHTPPTTPPNHVIPEYDWTK